MGFFEEPTIEVLLFEIEDVTTSTVVPDDTTAEEPVVTTANELEEDLF